MGITCPKSDGQSPTGSSTAHHNGDPMVSDAHATLLLTWLEKGWRDGDGTLPPQAGWPVWGRAQSLTETREMQRGLWNSAHHCSYHPAALCGGQLGSRSARRHRMCPILRKIKFSLLSETAKPFEGAAVLDVRIAWMQGFAMDCKRIFFSSATIAYLNCAPCQLLKGKKNSVWFCRKEYLGWILY